MEDSNFLQELQEAIKKKTDWFNSTLLQDLVIQYRLKYSCVHNLYDTMIKKNAIIPDPYRLDRKISQISLPDKSPISDSDVPKVFGERFSEYEMMLDYIVTYFRFSVENLPILTVKKLLEFNKFFDWKNISTNSADSNTHALAMCIATVKNTVPSVVQSMLSDSISKASDAVSKIEKILGELSVFQRELYKNSIRTDLFNHKDFNKEKAFSSAENEMAEIKRLYAKVFGKQPFYANLVTEIIEEDQGSDAQQKREKVLKSLQLKDSAEEKAKKTKSTVSSKDMILIAVQAIGGMAPTVSQIHLKLEENFALLFTQKATVFTKLAKSFRKAFKIQEKPKICNVPVKDEKNGSERYQKINVSEFLADLTKKERVLTVIASRQAEYTKIASSGEESVSAFVNKQIREMQTLFVIVNALDSYFKANVDIKLRSKIKGMQIELSSFKNSIVNANKKRSDYASFKEEAEQMKKLGMNKNE